MGVGWCRDGVIVGWGGAVSRLGCWWTRLVCHVYWYCAALLLLVVVVVVVVADCRPARFSVPCCCLHSSQVSVCFPTLQPQNSWLSHFLTLWPPHLEQSPQDIRHSATLSSFKSKLKTFLFSEYFS